MDHTTSSDPLLQPFRLKHLMLKNRIMSTSHEPAYAEDALPKKQYQLYHEEKAKGGLALTMFGGSTNVAPDSPAAFGQLYAGNDEIIPYYRQMAERVHRHGAAIMCQLTHMGRRTRWDVENWLPVVAPSLVREPMHRAFPKVMEEEDIRRIVEAYAAAALRTKQGGLDGIEVIAYGHLMDQFWTPLINQRADRYGGSLENRMRFSLEVYEAIRRKVGDDYIVGIRMSGSEDREGGLGQDELTEIAQRLVATGMIDFVNITRGWIATDTSLSHVIPNHGTPLGPHLPLAAAIKEAVDVPVFHAARITDLETARHAIEQGLVDMVGMTRAHMADPYIVEKLKTGRATEIRACVGAGYCLQRLYLGHEALCIQNPATGREESIPHVILKSKGPRKKVVVVGGGPGGMEAARVCAERGHDVVLFEAAHELGGQVNLAARAVERRRELIGIVDWLRQTIERVGVDVRLNSYADSETVIGEQPDIVVVATGGLPNAGFLEAGEHLVDSTWDVIAGSTRPRGRVLVYDDNGGDQAASAVEKLAREGAVVELVTPDRLAIQEVSGTLYPAYMKSFYEYDVTITPDLRLISVHTGDGELTATFYNEFIEASHSRTYDAIVVEHGTVPLDDLYWDLKESSTNRGEVDFDALTEGRPQKLVSNPQGSFQLFRVGDAVASRNIHAAIYDSLRLCMTV
ncbi:MAG: NADH:flavin oxidoreductase [Acidimicrobiia bacterium]|nr:NADH:flavin oxidoreductase [Acidimicrobiia bacterium]